MSEIYQCKECEKVTPYDQLTSGRCEECHKTCPEDCGGCVCFIVAPCSHCVDHVNEEDL